MTLKSLLCLAMLTTSIQVLAAEGNAVKGEELFQQQCAACHQVGEGAQSLVGPALNHLFGRKAGTLEGYEYSPAMTDKGSADNLLWIEKPIYIFLAGPERYVPGTKMAFKGLRREKEIRDVMAWLIQYSPAYEADSGNEVSADAAMATTLPAAPGNAEEEAVPEFSADFMANTDAIAVGDDLWGKQCRHCHGNSAYPGKAPKLKPAGYTPDFVFDRITNGFRKMPAWKSVFTLDERKAMVAYVMSPKFSP